MTEILSQSEIDALLSALTAGEVSPDELKEEEKSKRVRPYDFRRPNKFSKEQINTLQIVYENYARSLATFLSAQLRHNVQVAVLSVEQLTYDEFIRSLPDPSTLVIFSMDPLEGNGVFEIQAAVVYGMIDRLFGGAGGGVPNRNRALTEIERAIIERLSQRMLELMKDAWENVVSLQPRVEFIESNPQFAQIVSPMEMVILISLETRLGEVEGVINFCIPYIVLEPVMDKLSVHFWFARTSERKPADRQALQHRIETARLPLRVMLGTATVTVRELLELQVGDVVPLDRKVDQNLDVFIGNSRKFYARPGIQNKRMAVQITGISGKGGDLA